MSNSSLVSVLSSSSTSDINHCRRLHRRRAAVILWGSSFFLSLLPLWAQDATQTPATSQNGGAANRSAVNPIGSVPSHPAGTSRDRLFFTLPNFFSLENASNVPPMTTGEKFKTTARSAFDPMQFVWYGALAGISQARNTDSEFGQGAQGYGKRFGLQFADGTIQDFFTRAIYPSLLHQDPRYYQMGKGGFFHRTGYAMSRVVITRSDSGHTQFNFSEALGGATSAGISTFTYHPTKNVNEALDTWGTQVAYDVLSNVVREFWPDIRRKFRPDKSNPAGTGTNH